MEDKQSIEFYKNYGYREAQRIEITQRSLPEFRSIIDRRQTGVRRSFRLQVDIDPEPQSWWEACTLGTTDRTRFWLVDRKTEQMCGNVTFWDIQPLARNWGVRAMGLYDLSIDSESRQGGLATFLVSESLRYMQQQGISLVEAQVATSNEPAINLFKKLGFDTVDQGIVMTKDLA